MKLLKLAAPLLIAAALCGCSSTGLGDKVIVKALLLDYHQYEYLAQVLVLEAAAQCRCRGGRGNHPID